MGNLMVDVEHAISAVEGAVGKMVREIEAKYGPQVSGSLRKIGDVAKGEATDLLHGVAQDTADATDPGTVPGNSPTPTSDQVAGQPGSMASTPATGDETAAPATDSPSGVDVPVESDQPVSDATSDPQSATATNEQAPPVS